MPFGVASKVSFGVRVRGRLRLQAASHVRAPRVQYCLPRSHGNPALHPRFRGEIKLWGCLQVHQDQIWKARLMDSVLSLKW